MQILTFGNCCKNSKQNHLNAVEAAKRCGITEEVKNISDWNEIAKYGVMANPAIAINGKVLSSGRMLSVDEIVKLIESKKA